MIPTATAGRKGKWRRRWAEVMQYAALGLVFVPIYLLVVRSFNLEDLFTVLVGAPLAGLFAVIIKYDLAPRMRRLPFVPNLLGLLLAIVAAQAVIVVTAVWLSSALAKPANPFGAYALSETSFRLSPGDKHLSTGLSIVGVITLFAVITSLISRKLGRGVLWNWIIGRYHRPREEQRIFMMIDLNSSTTLAEGLGALRFSALLKEFFADIGDAIAETGGEVSHYVGDEVVVSWPLKRGLKDGNCVHCFRIARENVAANAMAYEQKYGLVPQFKGGLHCGTVVVTEIGDQKSEIVFLGDVLNTTARIQAECKKAGTDFLVSSDVLALLSPEQRQAFCSIGRVQLRGKQSGLELYRLGMTSE